MSPLPPLLVLLLNTCTSTILNDTINITALSIPVRLPSDTISIHDNHIFTPLLFLLFYYRPTGMRNLIFRRIRSIGYFPHFGGWPSGRL